MNLFASSGGLPVWANLMLAVTDEVQSALQGELAARGQRIAKDEEKYQKSAGESKENHPYRFTSFIST